MTGKGKTSQNGNAILILIAMIIGVVIGLLFASHGNSSIQSNSLQGKLIEVMNLVQSDYVDQIDADSISEVVVSNLLTDLDPHSSYLSARETQRNNEMMRGSFEGVGIVLHRQGDTTFVGQVMDDGPSSGSGILPGDMIVSVGGEQVSGCNMPADSVVARLRGKRGSVASIEVSRIGEANNLHFSIRRGVVPRHTIPYSAMMGDTTGYILLTSFASTTHDEFRDAVRSLKARGMRHLVIDLRGNGGGSLSSAIGIADELLPQGQMILYTAGAHSRRRNVYAKSGGLFEKGKVTVMVDENSASASEVVSGALQDNDRATIVGHRTFGKGLVQTEFELSDGSAILLTTARYYTPSGRCIQRPYDNGTDQYYREYFNQLIEETYADSAVIHIADSTPYHTTSGRVVYGGGGIVPDRILPVRKDSSFVYYNQLSSRGLIVRTAFSYVRHHAKEITRTYPSADLFASRFTLPANLVEQLVASGEAAGIPRNASYLKAQRRLIEIMLKAYIGQAFFGDEGFYQTFLLQDEDLHSVISNTTSIR